MSNISLENKLQRCINILDSNKDINTKAREMSEALDCDPLTDDEFEKFFFSDEVLEF